MQSGERLIADMHTHSDNSHDSKCKMEDMCLSQIQKGTRIMAVTDHCDTFMCNDYDIYTPLINSYNEVCALGEKYNNKCMLLSGVEIGEGFWFPKECERVLRLVPYDVILGSVHCVKYNDITEPYSIIDFSTFNKEQLYGYIGAYFDDMLTMLDCMDFDILTHLTCPLRYISGKYKREIDLSVFDEKITEILKCIIKREIALEINTSSFNALNDFMPPVQILKKYRELGGSLIALGSDAHSAQNASAHFDKAIACMKKLGFYEAVYYKNRKCHVYTI